MKKASGSKSSKSEGRGAPGIKVLAHKWGSVETSDGARYKDAIICHRTAEWDWRLFGLSHSPGYTAEVLMQVTAWIEANTTRAFRAAKPRIYLSTGVDRKIQVPVPDSGSLVTYLQSDEAVAEYNADVEAGRPCILFLHTTC